MIEFIALLLIVMFYVIPLNPLLYKLCETIASCLLGSIINLPFEFLQNISLELLASIFYVLIFIILFLLLYFLLSNVVKKSLFVFKNIDIDNWSLIKYTKGQKSINVTARVIIILLITLQGYFKVIDIKIAVLGTLCLLFIFKELKPRKMRKSLNEMKVNEKQINNELVVENGEEYIDFCWSYLLDALNIKEPIDFHIRFKKGEKYLIKDKNTLLEVQKNVKKFSEELKNLCDLNRLDNFQKISALYSLLSRFKYINDADLNISNQTPSDTLERQEGNGYSLGVCAATILRAMSMEVIELSIPLKDGGTKLTLAVEGADELVGNYYINNNKKYFYCELKENNVFLVGQMPESVK